MVLDFCPFLAAFCLPFRLLFVDFRPFGCLLSSLWLPCWAPLLLPQSLKYWFLKFMVLDFCPFLAAFYPPFRLLIWMCFLRLRVVVLLVTAAQWSFGQQGTSNTCFSRRFRTTPEVGWLARYLYLYTAWVPLKAYERGATPETSFSSGQQVYPSPFKPTRADACKRNPSNEQPNAIR